VNTLNLINPVYRKEFYFIFPVNKNLLKKGWMMKEACSKPLGGLGYGQMKVCLGYAFG